MKRYDIDWCILFEEGIPIDFINKLVNTLNLKKENSDYSYKINRSLDIVMPIILTKCSDYIITNYRDDKCNKFIINIKMK